MNPSNLSKEELSSLLKQAQKAHAEYEKFLGAKDDDWSNWYADFILKKLTRKEETNEGSAPTAVAEFGKPVSQNAEKIPTASETDKIVTDRIDSDKAESSEKIEEKVVKTGDKKPSTQLCPTCAHVNRPGVLICENCGTNLSTGQQLVVGTRDLRDAEEKAENGKKSDSNTGIVQSLAPEEARAIKSAGTSNFESNMSLRIEIEGGANPVLLKPQSDDMILGRRDPTTGATPEVDLTPYAGYRMGVSRKHASLRLENNEINLWDLGSSNGTFLNGSRLAPHRPYTVRDGDEIRLGQMVLRLFFQSSSKS